jgi:hypothetical protein
VWRQVSSEGNARVHHEPFSAMPFPPHGQIFAN